MLCSAIGYYLLFLKYCLISTQQATKLMAANVARNDANENNESEPKTVMLQVRNPKQLA